MISSDHQGHTGRRGSSGNRTNGVVCCLTGAHRSGEVARVPNHVGIRNVGDDQFFLAVLDRIHNGRSDRHCLHLWREIVGRDMITRNQESPLTGKCCLDPAVQEVGHMGVLLCLSHMKLAHASGGDQPSERWHHSRPKYRLD